MISLPLERLIALYMGAPLLIFLGSWIVSPLNILLLALGVCCLFNVFRQRHDVHISRKELLLVLCFSTVCCLVGGVGGYAMQNSDYLKHNFIFESLAHNSWPVTFQYRDGTVTSLVYYFGYYLCPAIIGHFFGNTAMDFAYFVWTILGLVLGSVCFIRFFKLPAWTLFLLWGLSGLELVGNIATHKLLFNLNSTYSWWAEPIRFVSLTETFLWSPNHFLAAFLSISLYLQALEQQHINKALAWICLVFFWSPFIAIALAIYLIHTIWKGNLKNLFNAVGTGLLVAFLFPLLVFYSSRICPDHLYFLGNIKEFQQVYLPSMLWEVLIWLPIIRFHYFSRWELLISIAALLVIPFFTAGAMYDLTFRTTVVPRLVMWGFVLMSIIKEPRTWRIVVFSTIFILGSLSPIISIYKQVGPRAKIPPLFSKYCKQERKDFWSEESDVITNQYLGNLKRNLLTDSILQPTTAPCKLDMSLAESKICRIYSNFHYEQNAHDSGYYKCGALANMTLVCHESGYLITIQLTARPIVLHQHYGLCFFKQPIIDAAALDIYEPPLKRFLCLKEFADIPALNAKTPRVITEGKIDVADGGTPVYIHTYLKRGATRIYITSNDLATGKTDVDNYSFILSDIKVRIGILHGPNEIDL
jgi:hypothetical protein